MPFTRTAWLFETNKNAPSLPYGVWYRDWMSGSGSRGKEDVLIHLSSADIARDFKLHVVYYMLYISFDLIDLFPT